ncbi:MAG: IS66 family insertion sequence element accessory protein TnpA [Candidatus Saccharimonadales bacterium]
MEQTTMGLVPQSKANEEAMFSLISQREQSGISVKDFCKNHQLSEGTYYYWRKKLLNKGQPKPKNQQGFTMLQLDVENPGSLFCEMTLPHGGRLRFYQPVSASFLQSLLQS